MKLAKPISVGMAVALIGAISVVPAGATTGATGEILTGNLFLGTSTVEMGARPNGSFGSSIAAPAGYHPRTTGSNLLGFRTNPTNCDWDQSSCEEISQGDFFTPGTPYEAWALQVGSGTAGFNTNSATGIAGSFTSVDSITPQGTWQSAAPFNGLDVQQEYRIRDLGIETDLTLTNSTGSAINDIYFLRGVDADNCVMEARPGLCTEAPYPPGTVVDSTYETFNTVIGNGASAGYGAVKSTQTDDTSLVLQLFSSTANAFTTTGGFASSGDLESIYNGTASGYVSNVGVTSLGDKAIYVVDRIASIGAGESATLRYTYNLDPKGIDPTPPPTPTPTPTPVATSLAVKAVSSAKKLKPGKRVKLVKSTKTNGKITKVRATCTLDGANIATRGDVSYCETKIKKSGKNTRVWVTPLLPNVKVRIKIVAKHGGSKSTKWTRTWKARS